MASVVFVTERMQRERIRWWSTFNMQNRSQVSLEIQGEIIFKNSFITLKKYLITKYESSLCIEFCQSLTFSSIIVKTQVLLLDCRRVKLGELFSKKNLRGFVEEKSKRNTGVGQVCAPISPLWVFLSGLWRFQFLVSVSQFAAGSSWQSSWETCLGKESCRVDQLRWGQMGGPGYLFILIKNKPLLRYNWYAKPVCI